MSKMGLTTAYALTVVYDTPTSESYGYDLYLRKNDVKIGKSS